MCAGAGTNVVNKNFGIEHAISGQAKCRKCKETIAMGEIRMFKLVFNAKFKKFIKYYFHVDCMFKLFANAKIASNVIVKLDDIEGMLDMGPRHDYGAYYQVQT